MEKYIKLECRRCGWYTHIFNDEYFPTLQFQCPPWQEKIQKCAKCGYQVKDLREIPIVRPLEFDEGEG